MLVNVVLPTGLSSPRAIFNYDWITLLVMAVVAVAGVIVFLAAHRGREIGEHMIDTGDGDPRHAVAPSPAVAPGEPVAAGEAGAPQDGGTSPETHSPQTP